MNIFYYLNRGHEGLNKYASTYENDAEYLTGLFYGMLKEAAGARDFRKRQSKNRKKQETANSDYKTAEQRAAATDNSINAGNKAIAKQERKIIADEKAGRTASATRRRGFIAQKNTDNLKKGFNRYKSDVPNYLNEINNLKTSNTALKGQVDSNNATIFGLRKNIEALTDSSAKQAKRDARKLDILRILNNRKIKSMADESATALALAKNEGAKALAQATKRGKLKLLGGILSGTGMGLGLGAGGLALYNRQQAQ